MNNIAQFCKKLKTDITPRPRNPRKPVSCWSEQDRYQDEIVKAYVIIFYTNGCSWVHHSGCTMCGYFNESASGSITADDLKEQYTYAMNNFKGEPVVKIFTSGSFLDAQEIQLDVQSFILDDLKDKTQKISVESRPSFITKTRVDSIKKLVSSTDFEVGIGLETANDRIRSTCINKGFSFQDYQKAVNILKKQGFLTKTYLLIKPPFLTEKQAIQDAITTVKKIHQLTETISFNPMNIQRHTLVEYLWKRNQYRAPWLWSIIDILSQSKKIVQNTRLQCDISGGGKSRGAHNCFHCDTSFLKQITQFSLNQDPSIFQDLTCSCNEIWKDQLELESFSFGSIPDFLRWNQ